MDQIEAPIPQPEVVSRIPNQFVLKGGDVHVSFSATSITGEPLLEYRDSRHHVSARGKEIQQVEMGIGKLVTITLEPNADAGALLFSVVIPDARLVRSDPRVVINTIGITTRTGGFILATAQLDKYAVVKLTGEATFVVS